MNEKRLDSIFEGKSAQQKYGSVRCIPACAMPIGADLCPDGLTTTILMQMKRLLMEILRHDQPGMWACPRRKAGKLSLVSSDAHCGDRDCVVRLAQHDPLAGSGPVAFSDLGNASRHCQARKLTQSSCAES